MPFSVTQKTLERLDWPEIVGRLAARARTPRGAARLAAGALGAAPGGGRQALDDLSRH